MHHNDVCPKYMQNLPHLRFLNSLVLLSGLLTLKPSCDCLNGKTAVVSVHLREGRGTIFFVKIYTSHCVRDMN